MSVALRIGAQSAVTQGKASYDQLTGGQTTDVFEGDGAGINAIIATLNPWQRYELDNSDAPIYRLTVYSPDPSEAPVWELVANLKEKDIAEHETFYALSDDNVTSIRKFIKNPTPGAYPALTGGTTQVDVGTRLYQYMLRGAKKYFCHEYVLRYTVTSSSAFAINLAYASTEKTFPPTLSGTGLTLPSGIATSIGNIPAKVSPDSNYWWSWLKMAPTSRETRIGKVVVTGEYWLDLWNKDLYPAAP